jgi:hypothetical protein
MFRLTHLPWSCFRNKFQLQTVVRHVHIHWYKCSIYALNLQSKASACTHSDAIAPRRKLLLLLNAPTGGYEMIPRNRWRAAEGVLVAVWPSPATPSCTAAHWSHDPLTFFHPAPLAVASSGAASVSAGTHDNAQLGAILLLFLCSPSCLIPPVWSLFGTAFRDGVESDDPREQGSRALCFQAAGDYGFVRSLSSSSPPDSSSAPPPHRPPHSCPPSRSCTSSPLPPRSGGSHSLYKCSQANPVLLPSICQRSEGFHIGMSMVACSEWTRQRNKGFHVEYAMCGARSSGNGFSPRATYLACWAHENSWPVCDTRQSPIAI